MSTLEEELELIKGYSYQVWSFNVVDSELTLRATHKDKKKHNIHLTFVNVHYIQVPNIWTGDITMCPDQEMIEIASKTDLNETIEKITEKDEYLNHFKRLFSLYKAETEHSTVYLLGKLFAIEQDVDPVY
jgi:hypothetical protein